MTKRNEKCPLCDFTCHVHGRAVGITLRNHIKASHPEAFAEIQAAYDTVSSLKKAMREKYPHVETFF